jgi:hypothetical protein
MRRHWQCGKYVLRHKWYVFQECLKLGVPLLIAIFHDWDKFLPDEWLPYARCFYAPDGTKQYKEDASFTLAWNLHQKRNKHHWQWWVIMFDRGEFETIPMPDVYRREMLADWRGAGRAITGKDNTFSWYLDNYYKIKLHRDTRVWIDNQLAGITNPMTLEEIAQSNNSDVIKMKDGFLNHKKGQLA